MDWMLNGNKEFTKGGSLKRPSLPLIVEWIRLAWELIPQEMVIKSFKKCGISNSMDGDEDDILFTENTDNADGNEESVTNLDLLYETEMTDQEFRDLFNSDDESGEEEFEGF